MEFLNSYKNKRVFLTGHTGFKGSWLSCWLAKLGAKIFGYALEPETSPNLFDAANVQNILAGHTISDIRDKEALKKALAEANPEVVFHLAAQPLVRESYSSPYETFEVNVMGCAALLDCIRELGLSCSVVMITSDKCYENTNSLWGYRECDAMGGFDPYSASKGAAEILISSYKRSFFHPDKYSEHKVLLASARAGNVIGGGDWAKDRIIADWARCLGANKPLHVRCPQAVRPWQHVLEPLSGYLLLGAKMMETQNVELASGWNFGPLSGQEATVETLLNALEKNIPELAWVNDSDSYNLHEASFLRLCIDKATWKLGWNPKWTLEQTAERVASWYKKYYENPSASMHQEVLADIVKYENS